jgi:predicted AlkP superfamily pyrophosphatase or phosphodiesterase
MAHLLSDLSQSVFSSLGLADTEDSLLIGKSPAARECIVLIDGMGCNAIAEYGSQLPIKDQMKFIATLSSNFPSTTVTNLTSLGTGVHPGEHGMLGYTMRVPRSGVPGRLLNALRWDERVDPVTWQNVDTLFERGVRAGISVSHVAAKRYQDSGFTEAALRGAQYRGGNSSTELITQAAIALAKPNSFAYVYISDLDEAAHSDGMGSEKWLVALAKTNELVTGLLERLPSGTRIWLTADHGMINRKDFTVLGKDNSLLENVTLLGGEPRARHLYVRDGSDGDVLLQWKEFFGETVSLFLKKDAIAAGLFGALVTEDSFDRLGDVIAIPNGDLVLIEPDKEKQQLAMVGHHGGLTSAELEIPLYYGSAS